MPSGTTELPFEFTVEPLPGQKLFETYHGVFVNVQYSIAVNIPRGMMAKDLKKSCEFYVEVPTGPGKNKPAPVPFTITPDSLQNVKKSALDGIPQFRITGKLDTAVVAINAPFTGELTVNECSAPIKSIEIQLVRVETTGSSEGFAKEATEIQNVQLGDGDTCRNLTIPIYMILPRLFTCPTVGGSSRTFKIEFEVNLVVLFDDGHLISECFPIKIFRPGKEGAKGGDNDE